jgi:trehalose 6-phosphate synthase
LIPQLTAYDLVGLQTDNDATNLARYFENECRLEKRSNLVYQTAERTVRVGAFPIGI